MKLVLAWTILLAVGMGAIGLFLYAFWKNIDGFRWFVLLFGGGFAILFGTMWATTVVFQ